MNKKTLIEIISACVPMVLFVIIVSMLAAVIHSVVASGLVVAMLWIGYTAWVIIAIIILAFVMSS